MVKVMFRDKEWEVRAGMTVRDAILKVGLDPQAVLPVRDSAASSDVRSDAASSDVRSDAASSHVRSVLINEATILRQGDVIRLVAVISGG